MSNLIPVNFDVGVGVKRSADQSRIGQQVSGIAVEALSVVNLAVVEVLNFAAVVGVVKLGED